ncbi:MAG: hypothetical protein IH586_01320 [Anaerolineaceae bacterium]|nr:hypothetical protein [Anaerolineaceae bacterium]
MERSQCFPAFIAYFLPVIGWIYVGVFQRKNQFAIFHMRQSVGLVLFLILITVIWGMATWLLAWIPYAFIVGVALFTLPVTAYIFGGVVWIVGMVNALRCREAPLPIIGMYSYRLPI